MKIISGISSLLAIGILTPVQSILWLIILFISTALTLYNQNYMLMGILYILIYVGAIAILFLFILSLLKIEYLPAGKISKYSESAIITLLIVCFIPLDLTYDTFGIIENLTIQSEDSNILIGNLELIVVGNQLYTEYSILLILTGLILILSVVGAIAITK